MANGREEVGGAIAHEEKGSQYYVFPLTKANEDFPFFTYKQVTFSALMWTPTHP